MIKHYLTVAARILLKRKVHSAINVVGLAVSLAACLVIGKYVEFETSYDVFHSDSENIYRVISSLYTDKKKDALGGYNLGPSLLNNYPQIRSMVRTHGDGGIVRYEGVTGEVKFKENKILIVDSTFFDLFTFQFVDGRASDALRSPSSIIVTTEVAKKYFGEDIDPVGKTLMLDADWTSGSYIVSGVIKDVPINSHFDFDILLPMHNLLRTEFYNHSNERWDNFHTYLKIDQQTDVSRLQSQLGEFIKKYQGSDRKSNQNASLEFQPLLEIHYSPDLENPRSRLKTIYIFVLVAIFIALIACVNYINLSTARASDRLREVGIKKTFGVNRSQLFFQFVLESAVINMLAVVAAICLASILLPFVNQIFGQELTFDIGNGNVWYMISILFVAITIATSIYPALVMTSSRPVDMLKSRYTNGNGMVFRNCLIGFQVFCSLLLLVSTLVVLEQVDFMRSLDKHFETKQIVIVKGPEFFDANTVNGRMESLRNELQISPFVGKICTSFSTPGAEATLSSMMQKAGSTEQGQVGNIYWVDPDFFDMYNIQLLAGRKWDPAKSSDMESIIINEEAVKVFQLGSNEQALNERLVTPNGTLNIIGIVKNHQWNSFKQPPSPMIFGVEKISAANLSIQLTGDIQNALRFIQSAFKKGFPDNTFTYYFLDDFYNEQYKEEVKFGQLFGFFSALAVFIGALGMWGLASFSIINRVKEVSIRKVLGASTASITLLISKQFLKPILIGCVMCIPIAWFLLSDWLNTFPYRMNFSMHHILLPIVLLMLISLTTVCFQTIKAALTNPSNNLNRE